jgi:hypothetical protein
VLPALIPELTYEGMSVAEGRGAGLAWEALVHGASDEAERERIEKALRAYCGQDTLALAKLLGRLRSASTGVSPLEPQRSLADPQSD